VGRPRLVACVHGYGYAALSAWREFFNGDGAPSGGVAAQRPGRGAPCLVDLKIYFDMDE
jgi:hypothetical protein